MTLINTGGIIYFLININLNNFLSVDTNYKTLNVERGNAYDIYN